MGTLDNHDFQVDTLFYVEDDKAALFYRTGQACLFQSLFSCW